MSSRALIRLLPLGGILDFYILRGFLRIFIASLVCVTTLYFVIEIFERIDTLVSTGTPALTAVRYFAYKAPLIISRVIGFATLFSALFSLGVLVRNHEMTAIRSSGVSIQRIALPLLILSFAICLFAFVWNETIVPVFTQRADTIYKIEIKNKRQQSLLGTRDIWLRGENSFINVDRYDSRNETLEQVTIFLLDRDFSLKGVVNIPNVKWQEQRWVADNIAAWTFQTDGTMIPVAEPKLPRISEKPDDLKALARDPEEFSYFDLQKQITDMKNKGLDVTDYEVDLQAKLAIPVISPLMILIAIPFALKRRLTGSISVSFGVAMLLAFSYWILLAFCLSLGHGGALPPWAAAWTPNVIFAMIGLYLFTSEA